jgi:Glycosyl transferases group 1
VRILLWHVHGSWTTSFVHGRHEYLIPVLPGHGPYGRGRAETWDWPSSVVEVTPSETAERDIDLVILQRPEELTGLAQGWLGGRRPGHDVPAIYLEHSCPQGRIATMRHPAADRTDLFLVHVTHFNALFWDTGATPTRVIEHGVVDPGFRYTGELEHAAVTINDPVRRGRVTGTDLLSRLQEHFSIDLFGIGTESLGGRNLPQSELHREMARRRVYVHPFRWTSLGLSLLEAMHLGMPVVALATTDVPDAVPLHAGVVSNDVEVLCNAVRLLINDPEEAATMGKRAREAALGRFSLARFLRDWDDLMEEVCR